MTFRNKAAAASIFLVGIIFASSSFAQKLGASEAKQIIVETSHTYIRSTYAEPITFSAGKSVPNLAETSPEAALAAYLTNLAKGEVDAALKSWAAESQKFIQKKNASVPADELRRNVIAQNAGVNFQFMSRIVYNDYVLIEVDTPGIQGKTRQASDAYALKKENGVWRLTQDLADDPVMCCRDAPMARIRRVGTPGGEFRKVLEALK